MAKNRFQVTVVLIWAALSAQAQTCQVGLGAVHKADQQARRAKIAELQARIQSIQSAPNDLPYEEGPAWEPSYPAAAEQSRRDREVAALRDLIRDLENGAPVNESAVAPSAVAAASEQETARKLADLDKAIQQAENAPNDRDYDEGSGYEPYYGSAVQDAINDAYLKALRLQRSALREKLRQERQSRR